MPPAAALHSSTTPGPTGMGTTAATLPSPEPTCPGWNGTQWLSVAPPPAAVPAAGLPSPLSLDDGWPAPRSRMARLPRPRLPISGAEEAGPDVTQEEESTWLRSKLMQAASMTPPPRLGDEGAWGEEGPRGEALGGSEDSCSSPGMPSSPRASIATTAEATPLVLTAAAAAASAPAPNMAPAARGGCCSRCLEDGTE